MLNAIYCNPLIFFSLLWLTTYFWKQGCKAESQHCSPFTQVEHTNASSPLLFLQQLECLSFLLLIPLSGIFDSCSSKIPLQKISSLSAMALSFFSLPTRLYRATYKFTSWSCLLHLPHTFFPKRYREPLHTSDSGLQSDSWCLLVITSSSGEVLLPQKCCEFLGGFALDCISHGILIYSALEIESVKNTDR